MFSTYSRFTHDLGPIISGIRNSYDMLRRIVMNHKIPLEDSRQMCIKEINNLYTLSNLLRDSLDCYRVFELKASELIESQDSNLILNLITQLELKAKYCGVSFYGEKTDILTSDNSIYANRFFSTALMSILVYVLRSACFGSRIIFNISPGRFEMSYVGVPIPYEIIYMISRIDVDKIPQDFLFSRPKSEFSLFAAKKIFAANGFRISMNSEQMHYKNIYAELLVHEYLNSVTEEERYAFIHDIIDESQYQEAERIAKSINDYVNNKHISVSELEYLNTDISLSSFFQDYPSRKQPLIYYAENYISGNISKSAITIYYEKS